MLTKRFATFTLVAFLSVTASDAQAPEEPFTDIERVTAVDLLVDFGPDKAPAYLEPDDFEVIVDGEPQRVISVSAFGPAQHAPDGEPWTFVLYFDLQLTSPAEVRWAATELADVAPRLTDLGHVEIVLADPSPWKALPATRDLEIVQGRLAELAFFPIGGEHELLALRDDYLDEIARPDSEIDPTELARFAVEEEGRVVERQLDSLLSAVVDGVPAGARRAVFLVSAGWEDEPRRFYAAHLEGGADLPGLAVDATLDELGRTLAAYGWSVFPLAPPPDSGPVTGFKIGKWRIGGKPKVEIDDPGVGQGPLGPHEKVGRTLFNFLSFTREDRRDEERAESYVELGATLTRDGKLEEAENAYELALYHFADDSDTVSRQAEVHARLGEILDRQGRRREARRAFAKAKELDPEQVPPEVGPVAELDSPLLPLRQLAASTTGALLRSDEDVTTALDRLAHRVRITYQVSGPPDGELRPVEVRCRRKSCDLLAHAWTRTATPTTVAEARIRRMWLADELIEGNLGLKARLVPVTSAERRYRLEGELEVPPGISPERPATLGVTLATGDMEEPVTIEHQRLELVAGGRDVWAFGQELRLPDDQDEVAVVAEHLETGRWGAKLIEIPVEQARVYKVRAVVTALPPPDREPRTLRVHHEAIDELVGVDGEVWGMDAMEMPFLVHLGVTLGDLAVGDKVEMTLEVNWTGDVPQQVTAIRKLPPETELELSPAKETGGSKRP